MNHRFSPPGEHDRSARSHTHASDADRSRPAVHRGRRFLGELLRGAVFGGAGLLLGTCPLAFGTVPMGIALLAASSSYTWWIAGGAVLGAFLHPGNLTAWAWVGVYAFLLVLRLCIRFFVDPPSRPDGQALRPRVYLSLCWFSFRRNIGLGSDRETDRAEPLPFPFPGYKTPEMQLYGEHPFLRMLTAAVVAFFAGLIGMIAGGFHVYDLLGTLFLVVMAPVFAFLFVAVFGEEGLTLLFSPTPISDMPPRAGGTKPRETASPDGGMAGLTARFRRLPLLSVLFLLCAVVFAARTHAIPPSLPLLRVDLSILLGLLFSLFAASRLGAIPGLAVAIVVGPAASLRLSPVFLLAAGGYALLRYITPRAGLLGGCTAGAVWCASVEGMAALFPRLPAILLTIPVYLIVERAAKAFPLSETPVHEDRELEGFAATVSAALAAENRAKMQRARLGALAEALASLSRRFNDLSGQLRRPRSAELRRLCDEAFSARCAHCRERESCHSRMQAHIRAARTYMVSVLEADRQVDTDRLPNAFLDICPHAEDIVFDVNRRYAHLRETLNRQEKSDVFATDYAAMASLLGDALDADRIEAETMGNNRHAADCIYTKLHDRGLAIHGVAVTGREADGRRHVILQGDGLTDPPSRVEDIRALLEEVCHAPFASPVVETDERGETVMTFAPRARLRTAFSGSTVPAGHGVDAHLPPPLTHDTPTGTYTPPAVCGDHVALFHNGEAYFYALISDGMGSGEEASVTSEICASFLEKLLSAGGSAELSLRMLDGYLHAKNTGTGEECSATVDLMELDLMDGRAIFAKSGAAPTYVVRDGTVYKLRCRSLPLGILRNTPPELLRFRMNPGDVVVMVSDGVTHGRDECPWLIDLLSSPMPRSMDELRYDIIRRALASGAEDDLSAIAIRVEKDTTGRR